MSINFLPRAQQMRKIFHCTKFSFCSPSREFSRTRCYLLPRYAQAFATVKREQKKIPRVSLFPRRVHDMIQHILLPCEASGGRKTQFCHRSSILIQKTTSKDFPSAFLTKLIARRFSPKQIELLNFDKINFRSPFPPQHAS